VKADGHHSIGQIKSFLNAITMVNVDIDVQHAFVILEKLQNCDDDVVHIAKAGSFELFRVVQPSGPVDSNVTLMIVELLRSLQAGACVSSTKIVQSWKVEKSELVSEPWSVVDQQLLIIVCYLQKQDNRRQH
jgi:hypothetical protein